MLCVGGQAFYLHAFGTFCQKLLKSSRLNMKKRVNYYNVWEFLQRPQCPGKNLKPSPVELAGLTFLVFGLTFMSVLFLASLQPPNFFCCQFFSGVPKSARQPWDQHPAHFSYMFLSDTIILLSFEGGVWPWTSVVGDVEIQARWPNSGHLSNWMAMVQPELPRVPGAEHK